MYRILGQHGEIRERRAQLRHPVYQKPELLAERPNQVWSWANESPHFFHGGLARHGKNEGTREGFSSLAFLDQNAKIVSAKYKAVQIGKDDRETTG